MRKAKAPAYGQVQRNAPWRKNLPSDAQVRMLKNLGINVDWKSMNKGQVSDVIAWHAARTVPRQREREVECVRIFKERADVLP